MELHRSMMKYVSLVALRFYSNVLGQSYAI